MTEKEDVGIDLRKYLGKFWLPAYLSYNLGNQGISC